MMALLAAYGFDTVILETVGAGQGDTAVREQSDVLVVLLQPESGDELQWEKAGLLEVADIVVVHKADLPGSDRMAAQVHEHLNLPGIARFPYSRQAQPRDRDSKNYGRRSKSRGAERTAVFE